MGFFKVEVEERLVKVITVKAETEEEAERLIKELYNSERIVLTEVDYQETIFFTESIDKSEFNKEDLNDYTEYTNLDYEKWILGVKKLTEKEMKELIWKANFELIEKNGKYQVENLEEENLGDIEVKKFDSLEDVLEELEDYFKKENEECEEDDDYDE